MATSVRRADRREILRAPRRDAKAEQKRRMSGPWPILNVEMVRADAADGWSPEACALRRGFNIATVKKHAKLHRIVFAKHPREMAPDVGMPHRDAGRIAAESYRAARQLEHEIAAAKDEAERAPLFRGGWPDE